jgi:hypothetical protein
VDYTEAPVGAFLSTWAITVDFISHWMLPSGCILVALSILPFPRNLLLGNEGQRLLSVLALPMWLFACGLVCASQYILFAITAIFAGISKLLRMESDRCVLAALHSEDTNAF